VELGARDDLFAHPRHPYTQGLLAAAPIPDPAVERARARPPLTGAPPSPFDPAAGLRFLPSKRSADAGAPVYAPKLVEMAPGHWAAEFDPI
jgi:peptide/nickel transport system ATP-binding protein